MFYALVASVADRILTVEEIGGKIYQDVIARFILFNSVYLVFPTRVYLV